MYRREHRHQLSFEDFFLPFGGKLSGDETVSTGYAGADPQHLHHLAGRPPEALRRL
jgi:hypothetical protein